MELIERQAALDCFHDWIDSRGDEHTADEIPEYSAIEAIPAITLTDGLYQVQGDKIWRYKGNGTNRS